MAKMHFLDIFLLVYKHLQLESMPFFPQASCLITFSFEHVYKPNFWGCYFLGFSIFSFSCFLAAVVGFVLGSLQFKNSWKSIITMGNSYHQVAKSNGGKFPYEFFTQTFCLCIYNSSAVNTITLIWVSLERSLLPAELCTSDTNIGQMWQVAMG